LQVAFGVRERASEAGTAVIRNLNLPTGHDVDRIARRLRSLSERLEEVEDALDRLNREVAELRRDRDSARSRASSRG
jgi:chromosome segregation ATPase